MPLDPDLLSNVASTAVGAALGGGVVAWRKAGAENEQIAVETMRAVIGSLRCELDRKQDDLHEMDERHRLELDQKQQQIASLREQVEALDRDLATVISEPPPHLG